MFGDRLLVAVEGSWRLAEGATGPVQSAEDGEAPSFEQAYPRRRTEVPGEGEPEGEIPGVDACDLGIEQLVEEHLAARGYLVDLPAPGPSVRQRQCGDLG